jgi:prophage regulatory protein
MSNDLDGVGRFLRLPDVQRETGLSRSQIYALAKTGRFPAPVKLSERCSAWLESAVNEWKAGRIAAARVPQA